MSHPPPATPVPLADYWQMLRRHDWTHAYSDDNSVWERGSAELYRLREIAKQSENHSDLFAAMEAWGWNRGELPAQPQAVAA